MGVIASPYHNRKWILCLHHLLCACDRAKVTGGPLSDLEVTEGERRYACLKKRTVRNDQSRLSVVVSRSFC